MTMKRPASSSAKAEQVECNEVTAPFGEVQDSHLVTGSSDSESDLGADIDGSPIECNSPSSSPERMGESQFEQATKRLRGVR